MCKKNRQAIEFTRMLIPVILVSKITVNPTIPKLETFQSGLNNYRGAHISRLIKGCPLYFGLYMNILFSMTGMVDEQLESLFTYLPYTSLDSFSNSSYEPLLDPDFEESVLDSCDGDAFCAFDFAVTGDMSFGQATRAVVMEEGRVLALAEPGEGWRERGVNRVGKVGVGGGGGKMKRGLGGRGGGKWSGV